MDETMHEKSVKSNSNYEASASPSNPAPGSLLGLPQWTICNKMAHLMTMKASYFRFVKLLPTWEELDSERETFSFPFFALLAQAQFYSSSMDEE